MTDFLRNYIIYSINSIRRESFNHNGWPTWEISQRLEPVRSVIRRHETSAHGICEIMSAKWICEYSRRSSLRDWLTSADDSFNIPNLDLLAKSNFQPDPRVDPSDQTERWLEQRCVSPRENHTHDYMFGDNNTNYDPNVLLNNLKGVNETVNIKPLFALISTYGPIPFHGEQGHTMAIMFEPINAESLLFFDPNFGEFKFNNWNGFEGWFLYYFRKSHYSLFLGNKFTIRYF